MQKSTAIQEILNILLQVFVFIYEVVIVLIQISYIIVMWGYWIIRYPFKKVLQ